MNFHKESIHSACCRRTCKIRNHIPLPAGYRTHSARQLHTVGSIIDNRITKLPHYRERTHVYYKIMITKRYTSFGDGQIGIMSFFHFIQHVFHIFRRHELSFFYIYRFSCHRRPVNQIGLAAEKCGNLKHIQHFRGLFQLSHIMHIGKHRHIQFLFYRL